MMKLVLGQVLLTCHLLFIIQRVMLYEVECTVVKRFLLVLKFKRFVVKMASGMMPNGYLVAYNGWEIRRRSILVDPDNVRAVEEVIVDPLVEAEKETEATKQALKGKIAQAAVADVDIQLKTLPSKLRIEPEDSEDVKAARRKKIHSFKSKMRKEQIEITQNKRQNAWQEFQTTKGQAKKEELRMPPSFKKEGMNTHIFHIEMTKKSTPNENGNL